MTILTDVKTSDLGRGWRESGGQGLGLGTLSRSPHLIEMNFEHPWV